jgi:hypothetical protein
VVAEWAAWAIWISNRHAFDEQRAAPEKGRPVSVCGPFLSVAGKWTIERRMPSHVIPRGTDRMPESGFWSLAENASKHQPLAHPLFTVARR